VKILRRLSCLKKSNTYPKNRINRAMPQSLDMPASTTINMNIKTDTITTILFFTMLVSPGY